MKTRSPTMLSTKISRLLVPQTSTMTIIFPQTSTMQIRRINSRKVTLESPSNKTVVIVSTVDCWRLGLIAFENMRQFMLN